MPDASVAFDRAADYYDSTRGFPAGVETEVAALMARLGELTPARRVLEIGVGTGRIALPLARHVRAYHGIDLARPMLDRLRAKQTDEPIDPVQGDVTRLPYASAAFDAVIAVHVFHLIPAWRAVLAEVARVLRPDGLLIQGWNERIAANTLQSVWQDATHEAHEAEGAIPHAERATFLLEDGWREAGPGASLAFVTYRAPQDYLESIRQRRFSSMWKMSEATLQRGLAAVEAYVAEHYADPSQPEALASSFRVQTYLPPAP